ncbi:MAG: hypothetical protein H6Q89_2808 [Myxococcaceae bacterium]|nr:hypothetical protein [Myxococcaceae bacterium]
MGTPLVITKDTRISEILDRYGDIAEVMEVFGIKRVGTLSIRRLLGKFLTVERAAKVHRVPLERFLELLKTAIAQVEAREGRNS